jgi:hypothetical protein
MYEGIVVFYLISLTLSVFLLIHSVKQRGFIKRIAIGFSIFIILSTLILMCSTIVKAYKYKGMMFPPRPPIPYSSYEKDSKPDSCMQDVLSD